MNETTVVDMLVIAFGVACTFVLAVEAIHPFIDRACDEWRGLAGVSHVNDEDLYPEVDHNVIQAFLKEPSDKQREAVQVHIDRRNRRERAEEAMLLERLRK